MIYVGPVKLNEVLSFVVITKDVNGIPTDADFAPLFDVLSNGSIVIDGLSTLDLSGYPGAYITNEQILAADGFASGKVYEVIMNWSMTGSIRGEAFGFSVT